MRYEAPTDFAAASALLAAEAGITRVLAGGTDVLVQLRTELVEPDLIVDIKRIPGTHDITAENGGFRIGAAVSGAELGEHAGVTALWPGVIEGMELVGSTQVQGRATLTGNLCNASPAADSVPAMMTAGAVATIEGPDGAREAPVADIAIAPGKTSLAKGELITSIFLPARPARSGDAYLRFTPRTEMDIAVVGAAVNLTLGSDGACRAARVALGAVAPTAIASPAAAQALVGTRVDEDALRRAGAAASAACVPIDDMRGTATFRRKLAGVLTRRAAATAAVRAAERG